MENEPVVSSEKSKSKILPVAIVVIVVIILVAGMLAISKSRKSQELQETATGEKAEQTVVSSPTPIPTQMITETLNYKDGKYNSVGKYVSPGGEESIDVTVTLKNGIVEDANVISNAFRPIAKQKQAAFIGGFKEQVIGKKITDLNLTKVAGSSLTPKGFNDAIEKIKLEAKSS